MQVNHKVNYKKAYESYRKVLKNPTNPLLVFQFTRQLVASSLKKNFKQLLESKSGGEVVYSFEDLTSLKETLSDRPEGSVGKECYRHFPKNNLIRMSKRQQENRNWLEARHPYNWLAIRYIECHDIWHILTGYPPDDIGEMRLAMFSFAQTKFLGLFMLAVGLFFKNGVTPKNLRRMISAYNNGKKASYLLAENYDSLLSENIQDARRRLNIHAYNTQN